MNVDINRELFRCFRSSPALFSARRDKKQQRGESHILRRSRNVRQSVIEELLHLRCPHLYRMSLAVKEYVSLDPVRDWIPSELFARFSLTGLIQSMWAASALRL